MSKQKRKDFFDLSRGIKRQTGQRISVPYGIIKDEWHPKGYNWNGPFTQNMERMALTYDGNVGTESFFLPANELDLAAFVHDLEYFSPSPIARAYADNKYYKNYIEGSKKPIAQLSKAFIYSAWVSRLTNELVRLGVSLKFIWEDILNAKDWIKFYKSLWIPSKLKIGLEDIPSGMGEGTIPSTRIKFDLKGKYFATELFGKKGVVPEPYKSYLNKLAKKLTGSDLRGARGEAFYKTFLPLVFKSIGLSIIMGSKYAPRPIKALRKINAEVRGIYEQSEEFKLLSKQTSNVKESYLEYLNQVGFFDKDGEFIIKDDIDTEKAKRAYIEYYKRSKDYFDWLNKYYKDYPDFEGYVKVTYPEDTKWEFPQLNNKELDNVANPVMKKPPAVVIPPDFKFDVLDPFPMKKQIAPPPEEKEMEFEVLEPFPQKQVDYFMDRKSFEEHITRAETTPPIKPTGPPILDEIVFFDSLEGIRGHLEKNV